MGAHVGSCRDDVSTKHGNVCNLELVLEPLIGVRGVDAGQGSGLEWKWEWGRVEVGVEVDLEWKWDRVGVG